MSNRSYPADFSRPLREVPIATDADVQAMLARLRRRCKVGKTSGQLAHEEARPRAKVSLDFHDSSGEPIASVRLPDRQQLPMNLQSKLSPIAVANIDAASSAGPTLPAGGLHVSATAEKTACAGGGSTEAEHGLAPPFQPTRSAPILGDNVSALRTVNAAELGNVRSPQPSQSNEGLGGGCENPPDCSAASSSLAPPVWALQWERVSPTAMRTTCGTWTCAKVTVIGEHRYELWRRIAGLERPARVLNPFKSFEDAKVAAQDEMDRVD